MLTSIELPTAASQSLSDRCAIGIEPNKKRIREHLGNCLMLVAELNLYGYDKAAKISLAAGAIAEIAREALRNDFRSIHAKDAESGRSLPEQASLEHSAGERYLDVKELLARRHNIAGYEFQALVGDSRGLRGREFELYSWSCADHR